MGEQVSGQDEVVEPWDLHRVVIRHHEGTTSAQGKPRLTVWAAAALGVIVILAVTGAPQAAYVVTGAVLLLVAHAGLRHTGSR